MVLRFRKSIPATRGLAEMMANLNFEIVAEQEFFTRPSHDVPRVLAENLISVRIQILAAIACLKSSSEKQLQTWRRNNGYITSEFADLHVERVRFHW